MKLLVFAHHLELGGTQINAIELSTRLRDMHGFDVVVHATEGPALSILKSKALRYIPAPDARLHPSPARIAALRSVVSQERPDLIHAWDWWQGLEAYYGVHLMRGTPLLITDMMMDLTRSMPRRIPTTFGFAGLVRKADAAGWKNTHLLLPPVDVDFNAAGIVDGKAFRTALAVRDEDILLVSVSRLANHMKSECLERAIAVVGELGASLPLRLVLVGNGEAGPRLQAMADAANRSLGREAVTLYGAMSDPRAAYDAADVVIGMGGSALRGMAFSKPLIVVGEKGFARTFTPEAAPDFIETGMFGIGDGDPRNVALSQAIRGLATSSGPRTELGAFGRDFVTGNHGLDAVAATLAGYCRNTVAQSRRSLNNTAADALRTGFYYMRERRFRVPSRDVTAQT
ncbi:glycosyltransferase [Tropicimonas isoalkanivorans]|uniref:Glycosyltransferase involved in cell wall bisynthesis n=1 Tax=Tropicimonas isoalkanivorans TaxID=441112 RepID=A0A1I1LL02_9RHOB|nr:glycosyltransferase [Tropicimonas isoalkanivorans]SFC73804.1 Glycosyltransferase involved in cell wall bisynthesis [Tropicimonas isoalkanivorans]